MEGQGETKQRFYERFSPPRRTQRGRERHPVAVKLRSKSWRRAGRKRLSIAGFQRIYCYQEAQRSETIPANTIIVEE
jgi:hypothetical protein